MGTRGVVMLPHLEVRGPRITFHGNGLSRALLRRSAVYWDRLDIPTNQIVGAPTLLIPDARELMSAGVLTETPVTISGRDGHAWAADVSTIILGTQWALFEGREGQEPGCWAIAQDAAEMVASVPQSEKKVTAEVELHNLLPVPGDDVPIAEVLEFKQKRQAELGRLREELDALSEQIGSAQNVPRTRDAATERVQTAVADAFRVMQESFVIRVARNVKIGLSLGAVATAAAAVVHIPVPPLVGAVAGMIGYTIREARAPKNLVRTGPFAYIHDLMKEIT